MIRLLMGIAAVTSAIDKDGTDETAASEKKTDASYVPNLSTLLANMLRYELDSKLVLLTRLKGVGGKTAKRLAAAGYTSLRSIAEADPEALSRIPGVGRKQASAMVSQAPELLQNDGTGIYEESPCECAEDRTGVQTKADPYRLRRSLELYVKGSEGPKFVVSGGREDHIVFVKDEHFTCDCMDYEKNGGACKHILCVKRSLHDSEICRMVLRIREYRNHRIRESLPALWYAAVGRGRETS